MTNVEVFLEWKGQNLKIGLMRRIPRRVRETVAFEYDQSWIDAKERFSIDPALPIGPGTFYPPANREMFGTIGDSAPDRWGRNLMRRRERRQADEEGRSVRTLQETDYLLGVSDETRLGAIRFRFEGEEIFQAHQDVGVPGTIALGRLLGATERILRGEESDEDLMLVFAPGSSLGGARPKASILDQHNKLSIAKFPNERDDYSLERWESIALKLGERAGIDTADHQLVHHQGRPIFVSERFDRHQGYRIPFMSAMTMTQHQDREEASYLELVDAITEQGADPRKDRQELFRRIAFSVLVSNTDDHLRNHGFLRLNTTGWTLSPAYDINPTPEDKKPRILTTKIDYHDGTCSIDLLRSVIEEFSLKLEHGDQIIREVAEATRSWRAVAAAYNASDSEIQRMQTAFEHNDLQQALTLG